MLRCTGALQRAARLSPFRSHTLTFRFASTQVKTPRSSGESMYADLGGGQKGVPLRIDPAIAYGWPSVKRQENWDIQPSHVGGRYVGDGKESGKEGWDEFFYRWADLTGHWSRWHSRKYFLLDLDPYDRAYQVMVTEFERKYWLLWHWIYFMLQPLIFYLWIHTMMHCKHTPPAPAQAPFEDQHPRKIDFAWTSEKPVFGYAYPMQRCRHCRPLDMECKKDCLDKLKLEGYKFWGNGRWRQPVHMHEKPIPMENLSEDLQERYKYHYPEYLPGKQFVL